MPTRCLIESPLLTRLFASIWFQRLIGLQLATITLWNMVPSGFSLTGFGIYMLLFVSAIALGVSRIEVSMLARYSLLNFESVYLIIWATILFVCSAWQYSFELDTFGAGRTPMEYVFFPSSARFGLRNDLHSSSVDLYFLVLTLARHVRRRYWMQNAALILSEFALFLFVLFCDAFPRLPRSVKIFVRNMFASVVTCI